MLFSGRNLLVHPHEWVLRHLRSLCHCVIRSGAHRPTLWWGLLTVFDTVAKKHEESGIHYAVPRVKMICVLDTVEVENKVKSTVRTDLFPRRCNGNGKINTRKKSPISGVKEYQKDLRWMMGEPTSIFGKLIGASGIAILFNWAFIAPIVLLVRKRELGRMRSIEW